MAVCLFPTHGLESYTLVCLKAGTCARARMGNQHTQLVRMRMAHESEAAGRDESVATGSHTSVFQDDR